VINLSELQIVCQTLYQGSVTRYFDDLEYQADVGPFHSDPEQPSGSFALNQRPDEARLFEPGRFAAANPEQRGFGGPVTDDQLTKLFEHRGVAGILRTTSTVALSRSGRRRRVPLSPCWSG